MGDLAETSVKIREEIGEVLFGRHERGFVMWPLVSRTEGDDRLKIDAILTRALLGAAEAVPAAVRVKPLEWPTTCPRGQRVHNQPALVNYTISHYGADTGDTIYRWAEAHSPWSEPMATFDAAKAAAQADYEARILSTLEAGQTDRVGELVKALNIIDALDPEEHVYGTSHDDCRGLLIRMGQIARAALSKAQEDGE